MLFGDLHDRIHVGNGAVEVNDDDRFGAFVDEGFDFLRIHGMGSIHIAEHGQSAGLQGTEAGSNKTVGGADHFIAGTDIQGAEGNMQSCGSVGHTDGILDAEPFCPCLFESHAYTDMVCRLGTGHLTSPVIDLSSSEDIGNCLNSGLFKARPAGERFIENFFTAVNSKFCGIGFNRFRGFHSFLDGRFRGFFDFRSRFRSFHCFLGGRFRGFFDFRSRFRSLHCGFCGFLGDRFGHCFGFLLHCHLAFSL